jgi:hypothetical protein
MLFPEIYQMVVSVITRNTPVFCLFCTSKILAVCAEDLTFELVRLPERRGADSPYLNLMELRGVSGERLEGYLLHSWGVMVSVYGDAAVARTRYPKVYEFVREQILLKEKYAPGLTEEDIALLTILLMKNNFVFYKGKKDWLRDDSQIKRTLEHWFLEGEEV